MYIMEMCILCTIVYCLLYIVQMCILCKVCISKYNINVYIGVSVVMYIVIFLYLVTCTAMAQSLVPKNFTISILCT